MLRAKRALVTPPAKSLTPIYSVASMSSFLASLLVAVIVLFSELPTAAGYAFQSSPSMR